MVQWQSQSDLTIQTTASIKASHFLSGFFIWQFLTTLRFEIGYYRGKKTFEPSLLVYVCCRFFTLAATLTQLVGTNNTAEINCNGWYKTYLFFTYVAMLFSAGVFTTLAYDLWRRRWFSIIIPTSLILVTFALMMKDVSQSQAIWFDPERLCSPLGTQAGLNSGILYLTLQIVLTISLILGLYVEKNNLTADTRRAYEKGVLWVFAPTIVQVVSVVFLGLDLNEPMNQMFLTPSLVIGATCSTTMYRQVRNLSHTATSWGCPKKQADVYITRTQFSFAPPTVTGGGQIETIPAKDEIPLGSMSGDSHTKINEQSAIGLESGKY